MTETDDKIQMITKIVKVFGSQNNPFSLLNWISKSKPNPTHKKLVIESLFLGDTTAIITALTE